MRETPTTNPAFAANLSAEMDRLGLTGVLLARKLSGPNDNLASVERSVNRWRNGAYTPRWHNVCRLAEVFGRDPYWFFVPRDEHNAGQAEAA